MSGSIQRFLLGLLQLYKGAISPLFLPACRYVPTCSEYASEAILRRGPWRGSLMSIWRLLRCHPLAGGGYDPVRGQAIALNHDGSRAADSRADAGRRHH
jgi:putative membrane protein insertion efficiency factor